MSNIAEQDKDRQADNHEISADHPKHGELEQIHKSFEESTDILSPDDRAENAHKAHSEALEIASSTEEIKHPPHTDIPAERRRGPISKKQLDHEFNQTMKQVQDEMPASRKSFSKVIHTPAVEKASDFLGATIARPNALLAGSIGAFSLTLGIYVFAKSIGYPLSGFEPIGAFIVGWILGMLYDYFRVMVTGKRS